MRGLSGSGREGAPPLSALSPPAVHPQVPGSVAAIQPAPAPVIEPRAALAQMARAITLQIETNRDLQEAWSDGPVPPAQIQQDATEIASYGNTEGDRYPERPTPALFPALEMSAISADLLAGRQIRSIERAARSGQTPMSAAPGESAPRPSGREPSVRDDELGIAPLEDQEVSGEGDGQGDVS